MQRLYTPWRMQYLTDESRRTACIFCAAAEADDPRRHWVLHRDADNLAMLNLYPYSSGHIMIAPRRHWARPQDADLRALQGLTHLMQAALRILDQVYAPQGYNLGMNVGRAAGAGFADHYHLHIVPRWEGDTNFMTTVAETRLVPEDLSVTYEKLRPLFESWAGEDSPR